MSHSPAEVTAADALANMSSINSPLISDRSTASNVSEGSIDELELPPPVKLRPSDYLQTNVGVILDSGTNMNEGLGHIPLFNAAPLSPISLASNHNSYVTTEHAPSAEEGDNEGTPRRLESLDPPESGPIDFSAVIPASSGYCS
ncbi:uncharacterized protein PGTG_20044, partial [Puccinia graminis f. sp. tritici CRL 75-36-700-3]